MKRLIGIICVLTLLLSAVPFAAAATQQSNELTFAPVATQQRRMWCTTSYNSGDYVYVYPNGQESIWYPSSWARYYYARFMPENVDPSLIGRAVIRFDARTRESEPAVCMAAIDYSDELSERIETSLTGAAAFRYTSTGNTATSYKGMTDTAGRFLENAAKNVVAFSTVTAGDETTTENIYREASKNITYNHPVTMELDVTDTVKEKLRTADHLQFVLTSIKEIYTGTDGVTSLHDAYGSFAAFANGAAYDADGSVLATGLSPALSRKTTVCGAADYYTPNSKTDDDYFSWMYVVPDSITLEIELDENAVFQSVVDRALSFTAPHEAYEAVRSLLPYPERYDAVEDPIQIDRAIKNYLLSDRPTLEGLIATYTEFLNAAYFGAGVHLFVEPEKRGGAGTLTADVSEQYTGNIFFHMRGYDALGIERLRQILPKEGQSASYDVRDRGADLAYVNFFVSSDEAGEDLLSVIRKVILDPEGPPRIFITQITNDMPRIYLPDNGSQNSGSSDDVFEFVQLHNYSDYDVDLSGHVFEYAVNGTGYAADLIFDGSSILPAHETFLIGIYNQFSAAYDYRYATAADKEAYWAGFNEFYRIDLPSDRRAIAPLVKSGDGSVSICGGLKQLNSIKGSTYEARIRRVEDGAVVASADMTTGDESVFDSTAFRFLYNAETDEGEFLGCTGCFPAELLNEQKEDYTGPRTFISTTGKVRVISYNVLAVDQEVNGVNHTLKKRQPLLLRTMERYEPDIIGLQEVNVKWVPYLQTNMPSNYSCVEGISRNGHTYNTCSGDWDLLNPIYYRNDKFRSLASGYFWLTESGAMGNSWDSVNMYRTVTWVVLENITTGERLCHLNTHLVLSGKTGRTNSVRKLYNFGASLRAQYGCGIVITGDHNLREGTEPYLLYKNSGVVSDSRYMTTNHDFGPSYWNFGANSPTYAVPIDYCMVSQDDFFVEQNRIIRDVYDGEELSDHWGVLADLYFLSSEAEPDDEPPVIEGVTDGLITCGNVTFTVTDKYLREVTLNGVPITEYTVQEAGEYTLTATDLAGNETTVHFTLTGGHTFVRSATLVRPTCTEKGRYALVCTICHTTSEEDAEPLGHNFGTVYTVDTPATCTGEGSESIHCTRCGIIQEGTGRAIPPAGHIWSAGYTVDRPATTEAAGVKSIHCTVCDAIRPGSEVTIPKLEPPAAPAVTFKDVPKKAWYYDAVYYTVDRGIFKGITATTFEPDTPMTRAMFVATLSRMAGVTVNNNVKTVFSDVKSGQWYTGAVKWASDNDIVAGADGKFMPNDPITREQICTILVTYAKYKKITLAAKQPAVTFKDASKISKWAKSAVTTCQRAGLVTGSNGFFNPQGKATRAEVAQILMNFDKNFG